MEKSNAMYPTDAEIEAARVQGREERQAMPHAISIAYDSKDRRFSVVLLAGAIVDFFVDQVPELKFATDEQLRAVRLSPSGGAVMWDSLDVAISTTGLIMDLVAGPDWRRAYRAALMREITKMKSPSKAAAARENGKKGGRPRKSPQAS